MPIKVYNGSEWVQVSDGTDAAAGVTTVKQYTDSNYTVERSGSNPIIITDGGETIGIGSTSNAYGAKFVQSTTPANSVDGDIWYNVGAGETTASTNFKHGGSWLNILNSVSLLTYTFDFTTLNATQTWTKPTRGNLAFIFVWGGGGSGATNDAGNGDAGGGGGGCCFGIFPLSQLGATVSIIIGKGGYQSTNDKAGVAGGNSTFGTSSDSYYLKGNGGSGGVETGAGGYGGQIYDLQNSATSSIGGFAGGQGGNYGNVGDHGDNSIFGGAGGANGNTTAGAYSVMGGRGGRGGSGTSTDGTGGDGTTSTGSVPGGGGGGRANNGSPYGAGGNGQVKIYVL